MKITRMKKSEIRELTAEEHAAELKKMETHKGKMSITFEGNSAEQKLAKKHKAPFIIKNYEVLVIEE